MATTSWTEYQKEQARKRAAGTTLALGKGQSGQGGHKGGTPAWKMRMEFFDPKGKRTWVRMVPTTVAKPFFLHYSRWVGPKGGKKLVISNSHNGDLPVPDLVYYAAERANDASLLAKAQHAITMAVLEYYHEIPVANKDPKKKGYNKYERCGGKNRFGKLACQYCIDEEAGKNTSKKVFGQRKYWPMSGRTKESLLEEVSAKLNVCLSCGTGEIFPVRFSCPACKQLILDRYENDVTEDELSVMLTDRVECPHCHKTVKTDVEKACIVSSDGEDRDGCDNPKSFPEGTTAFDVEFQIEQDTENYALIVHAVRPIKNHAELPGIVLQPMPFAEFLQYMTLKDQAFALGMDSNPFGQEGEDALLEYFSKSNVQAVPSEADAEEADEESIPWDKK